MKKTQMDKFLTRFEIIRFLLAIIVAFAVTFILLLFFADAPLKAMIDILIGPLTSVRRFSTVIEAMIPLTFSGLAITVLFRSGQFNLAAEGSLYMGGLVAAMVAIFSPFPPLISIIIAIILAGFAGIIITAIPGYLKIKVGTSVLVISLMLNTVVLYFGTFLFNMFLRDPNSAYASSYVFRTGNTLMKIIPKTRLHSGFIVMILFVILTTIFLNKTKWGYKISLTGRNKNNANFVGINVPGMIMLSQCVGGFIAGIGGGIEMLGLYTRFQWMALPGYGFDGVVLNIIARDQPILIPFAAFIVSYIRVGADYMYRQTNVASEIVAIIEGIVIILIVAEGFLYKWKHKKTVEISMREEV